MNKNEAMLLDKANGLTNTGSSTAQLIQFILDNPSQYHLGISKNCTIYKHNCPACYVLFNAKSIEIWDEDQSGNECTRFDDLLSKFNPSPSVKLVLKDNGIPIQKVFLYTDVEVLNLLHALQKL